MADFENDLVLLLRDFTGKVAAVVRRLAIESAGVALERANGISAVNGERRRSQPARSLRPAAKPARSRSKQAFDREVVTPKVVSCLLANPGLRVVELAERLALPSSELKPLVKKLVGARVLRAKGNTRARQYFAVKNASSTGRARAKPKGGRKRRKKS